MVAIGGQNPGVFIGFLRNGRKSEEGKVMQLLGFPYIEVAWRDACEGSSPMF